MARGRSWVPIDDLEQEAAVRLLRITYDENGYDRSRFVATNAAQAMIDWLRTWTHYKRNHQVLFVSGDALPEIGTDAEWDAIDARLDLDRRLRRFPRRTQEALRLRYIEELSCADCAKALGVTEAGYFWILKHGSDRPMHSEQSFVPVAHVPKARGRSPDELYALVDDMPEFLRSLPPTWSQDVTDWLEGEQMDSIAKRHGVQLQTVRSNVWRAFVRAREGPSHPFPWEAPRERRQITRAAEGVLGFRRHGAVACGPVRVAAGNSGPLSFAGTHEGTPHVATDGL